MIGHPARVCTWLSPTAADPNFWSVRVSLDVRLVVRRTTRPVALLRHGKRQRQPSGWRPAFNHNRKSRPERRRGGGRTRSLGELA